MGETAALVSYTRQLIMSNMKRHDKPHPQNMVVGAWINAAIWE
jgi:hypothetical protein